MLASESVRLYQLFLELTNDVGKAKEYVGKIEQIIDLKFLEKEQILATKKDLSDAKVDIIKWYLATGIAVAAIIKFL